MSLTQKTDLEEQALIESLSEYQEWTGTTAVYPRRDALSYLAMGLASESGEVCGKLKKFVRDGVLDIEAVAAEIGDVQWYCARLCAELNLNLGRVMIENRRKLEDRKRRNVLRGSGDAR